MLLLVMLHNYTSLKTNEEHFGVFLTSQGDGRSQNLWVDEALRVPLNKRTATGKETRGLGR